MNSAVKLAKDTIDKHLSVGKLPEKENWPKDLLGKSAGCFVSIHTKDSDELRGCIGTILPVSKNLASEIISNAVEATRDLRFPPLEKDEITNLNISVDILSEPEPIPTEKSLDPKKYGVIVKSADGRTGLLLPDLEGVDDVMYQVAIARQKAGIAPEEPIFLYRFTVERFEEE